MRAPAPVEAHVSSFVDSAPENTFNSGSFQRISDDEELVAAMPVVEPEEDTEEEVEPEKHGFAERVVEKIVSVAKGKRATRKVPRPAFRHARPARKLLHVKLWPRMLPPKAVELANGTRNFEDANLALLSSPLAVSFATLREVVVTSPSC